jgi:fatty-acyl-CoA synthase
VPIRNQSDIAAIEAVPLSERALPESSYAALVDASKRSPDARALSFFLSADGLDEAHVWTYAELVADVTRAANVFAALGVAADRPAAYVLPNLPETHFAIWGGEAAGATLAVNPMLEPKQVADILRFARASILVTLALADRAQERADHSGRTQYRSPDHRGGAGEPSGCRPGCGDRKS